MNKKLENFWYYYKWYVIAGAFLLIGVIMCVKSCVDRVEPDVNITYMGAAYFNDVKFDEEVKPDMEKHIPDVNGDGKSAVNLNPLTFDLTNPAVGTNSNYRAGTMSLAVGSSRVFLLEKAVAERYAEQEIFSDLSEYGESGLYNTKGELYAIEIDGAKIGYTGGEPLYVSLRIVSELDRAGIDNVDDIDAAAREAVRYLAR